MSKYLSPSSPRGWSAFLCRLFCSNKYFLLLAAGLVFGFIWFGARPVSVVRNCHTTAQESAKIMIQQRLLLNPQNPQLQQAAQAGMVAEEDYVSAYRNCLRSRGYNGK